MNVEGGAEAQLIHLADGNLAAAYRRLAAHAPRGKSGSRRFGPALAMVTGAPIAFFNPVVLVGRTTAMQLTAAIHWVRAFGVEPSIQAREELVEPIAATARGLGLLPEPWRAPGMVLQIPERVPPGPSDLRVEIVGRARRDAWYAAAGAAIRAVLPESMMSDRRTRFVLGTVAGAPVAHAVAIRYRHSLGVYAVGTLPNYRRRGFGTAVSWAAIEAGRRSWGSTAAILQSSELGIGVYQSMGFREICRYAILGPLAEAE